MEDGADGAVETALAGQKQLHVCGGGTAGHEQGLPRSPRNAQDSEAPDIEEGGGWGGLKRRGAVESQCGRC